ncbi:penicillin acylase family protein [Nocardioides plantarum]|uniref:Penicillin acylase family protein n=1 Tax=Nocardioides plantarum TaxID=29299 RepID=A0ABV5KAP5_9ACTN|nr:penicillin acylase family protein [Nocardioides plantarum]
MTDTTTAIPADAPLPRGPRWWRRFRLLPRPLRISTYVAVVVVLAIVAGLLTGVVLVRRSFPQTTGEVELPGLTGTAEVVRDDHGIPQIYADTTEDLMRAQGYVHAQERFYEMDVRRHATAGRLSEMFGAKTLETDAYVRTMGWRRVAEAEVPLLDPDTRVALDAYAQGVNAYLEDRSPSEIALEYTLLNAGGLGYVPEPWTAVDSLAWLKAMAWDLRGNMADEIDRSLTAAAVGRERTEQLWPAAPRGTRPVVRRGAVVDGVFEQDARTIGTRLPTRPAPFGPVTDELRSLAGTTRRMPSWLGRGDGIGSNGWVVSGRHTDTGKPILADDPHLGVSLPGVWMQVGLHCRTVGAACPYDVAGSSFSGVPGVIVGHNADIAWGLTNLESDTTDLYVERIAGDQWRHGDELKPLKVREETIEVADGDDVTITVRSTDHGPLVSDVADSIAEVAGNADKSRGRTTGGTTGRTTKGDEYAVALSWTALTPAPSADAILALDRAKDWTSFRAAAADLAAPAQNLVYADRAGHIGYQATGRVPIRKSGNDGRYPAAGWRPDNDWTGEYVPYDGLPSVLDPGEGFVVTANQRVVGPDYTYDLGDDFDRGYRSERIRELLGTQLAHGGTVSMDDVLATQLDDRNPLAPVLVPHLLRQRLDPTYDDDGQRLLRDWDHTQPAEGAQSAAAAYFNAVWRDLLRLTFDDELTGDQRADGGQRWIATVTDLLQRPDDPWWDDVTTDRVETRDDILRTALLEARDDLTSTLSPDPAEWTWGRLHRLELTGSTLGRADLAPVGRLLDRGGWDVGGGASAVDATGWDARRGFEVTTAPSMRMVVSLADLDDSRWVNLTGVSGHAFHPHYTDQTDLMVDGETLPWAFSEDAVRDAGEDVLRLVPAD